MRGNMESKISMRGGRDIFLYVHIAKSLPVPIRHDPSCPLKILKKYVLSKCWFPIMLGIFVGQPHLICPRVLMFLTSAKTIILVRF